MKTPLLLWRMLLGVALAVRLAMNGMVGAARNNARAGRAVLWCIGAVLAMIGWRHSDAAVRTQPCR